MLEITSYGLLPEEDKSVFPVPSKALMTTLVIGRGSYSPFPRKFVQVLRVQTCVIYIERDFIIFTSTHDLHKLKMLMT